MTSTSLAVNAPAAILDAELTRISSFEDAAALLLSLELPVEAMSDYGTGFKVVDKATLVGVPLIILQWRFNEGDFEAGFVSVEAVTKHGEKVIFNDGSTGILAQLRDVTAQRIERGHPAPQTGLTVQGGLTMTSYFFNADTKETSSKPRTEKGWAPASTFYLAS